MLKGITITNDTATATAATFMYYFATFNSKALHLVCDYDQSINIYRQFRNQGLILLYSSLKSGSNSSAGGANQTCS